MDRMFYFRGALPPAGASSPDAGRARRILERALAGPPRLRVERARYFTASLRRTGGLPLPLRWSRALVHVMEHIEVAILPDELIVGRGAPEGRYGFYYPELEGTYFERVLADENEAFAFFTPGDVDVIRRELLPYWKGRTYHEGLAARLSDGQKALMYSNGDVFSPSFIVQESATARHSLQWAPDYGKVVAEGFCAVEARARAKQALLPDPSPVSGAGAFYQAVIELCLGIRRFAERYAERAGELARHEENPARRKELEAIARRCRHVPYRPARDFAEAVQAQWFTQLVSRFEQVHGGNVANGRIDQYLYPLYRRDRDAGRLSRAEALEYLDALWCNMAQFLRLQATPNSSKLYQDQAHWECATIGGQTRDGGDAGNELSELILESALSFPLDYPYLAVRIHAGTPPPFLRRVCEAIKKGKDIPVLVNDEEIAPLLEAKGSTPQEARDYCCCGVSEARCINRHTYMTGTTWLNLAAVLEMALNDGRCSQIPGRRVGLSTGASFASYDELWAAFAAQLRYVQERIFDQQFLADSIRGEHIAAPLLSSLHDLCMEHGMDVNAGPVPGGISNGGYTGVTGFATVVDSLAAVRRLVFEEGRLGLDELRAALAVNFEGHESLRQRCLLCPKFGCGDEEADAIAAAVDRLLLSQCLERRNFYGGVPEIFYVPVTTHISMGRVTGATPNGRRAGEMLSYGISPSRGADAKGPGMVLASAAACKNADLIARGARVLALGLAAGDVEGETGTRALEALVRAWCRQKHWFVQFHIYNKNDRLVYKNDPEKCRGLRVQAPGMDSGLIPLAFAPADSIFAPDVPRAEGPFRAPPALFHTGGGR